MAEYPALPIWTDAYLADTRHLSREEHGAYLLLLMEAWRRPACSLPDDDRLLARLALCSPDEWAEIRPIVMAFWTLDGRRKEWTQKRLVKERSFLAQKSQSQRDKAAKRWGKTKNDDAAAMPNECRSDAPTPTPTPIRKREANASPKKPSPAALLSPVIGEDLAAAVVEHRQRIKAPLTARAAQLLAAKFERCPDAAAAAETMMARGWRGFEPEWMASQGAAPQPQQGRVVDVAAILARRKAND